MHDDRWRLVHLGVRLVVARGRLDVFDDSQSPREDVCGHILDVTMNERDQGRRAKKERKKAGGNETRQQYQEDNGHNDDNG